MFHITFVDNLRMKSIIILSILSVHLSLKANDNILIPPHVKTQKQLSKYQVKRYIKSFPKIALECSRHFLRGSSYHRLLRNQGPVAFQNAFKLNYTKRFPRTENHFPFDNDGVSDVCDRDFGYCHGFSAALTYWNRLSHFDPENISKTKYPKNVGSDEWFEYYKNIIDKIMKDRKPLIVPGYNHLYEFASSHPRITRYLKEHIALEWAERNINISSYFKVLRQVYHNFTLKESKALYKKLNFQINELNFNPIVWIASSTNERKRINPLEIPGSIHNMQAYRIDPIDQQGNFKLYFWDIYSAQDADEAIDVYTISTTSTGANGKPVIFREVRNSLGKIVGKKKRFDGAFNFADMDTVPYDEMKIGEDAVNLMNFYKAHPEYTKYLEEKFESDLKNSPLPKFRVPYKGEEPPPKIKLADGSIWEVPNKMLYYTGGIWIEKNQIDEVPEKAKKVLDLLVGSRWREGKKIQRHELQLPYPYQYMDHNDIKTFQFSMDWFDYKGNFLPDEKFFDSAPEQLIKELKEYTLNWPPTRPLNFKFFRQRSYVRDFPDLSDEMEGSLWTMPIEFITANGLFKVPKKYESHVPAKVIKVLKKNRLWPVTDPINLQYLTEESRTIKIGNMKTVLPLSWYADNLDNLIKIPVGDLNRLPKQLSTFFYGFGPRAQVNYFEVSPQVINESQIYYKNDKYLFPKDWFKKTSEDSHFSDSFLEIPESQLNHVPKFYKEIIVGPGGQWPPANRKINKYSQTVELSDGNDYHFPLSWISLNGQLIIPKGQEHVLPQKVIDQIFTKGPYKWPLKGPVRVSELQYPSMELKDGSRFFWPREWMKVGQSWGIKLPKKVKNIEAKIPKEIQDKIKKAYNGKYPEDRKVDIWRIRDDIVFHDSPVFPDAPGFPDAPIFPDSHNNSDPFDAPDPFNDQ